MYKNIFGSNSRSKSARLARRPVIAIIKTGGKQYLVRPGDKIKIEKLDPVKNGASEKESSKIIFDEVLLLEKDGKIEIGTPFIKDAEVTAKVLSNGKGDKVVIFKYKPKKRESRKIGHRQPYTEIEITGIK